MIYQEGQQVKLREDLQTGEEYGGWVFTPHGKEFIGKTVTLGRWTDYENKRHRSKGFFNSVEVDTSNSTFLITTEMIDKEASKRLQQISDTPQDPFSELIHMVEEEEPTPNNNGSMVNINNIKPAHYRKGGDNFDLFEAAYRTRPFSEFRAIMEFVAERYLRRMKGSPEKRIEDIEKAQYTEERLKEKEIIELEKIRSLENKTLNWFSWHQEKVKGENLSEKKCIIKILNLTYFTIQDEELKLSVFKHAQKTIDSDDQIDSAIYHDITKILLSA